jgi:hypothetical protein
MEKWKWFIMIIFFGILSTIGACIKNDCLTNSGFMIIIFILLGLGIVWASENM